MSLLPRRLSTVPVAPASRAGGYSLLDSQLHLIGDIETDGSLRIDGRLDGSVRRADTVVLGAGATMNGDIQAREVIVGGTLSGSVQASERIELQSTAIVTGDITSQVVLVQEGGVVNGRVQMQPSQSSDSLAVSSPRGGSLRIPQAHR